MTTETGMMLGTAVAKKKTVHNYGQMTPDLQVMDSDMDAIKLTVPALP